MKILLDTHLLLWGAQDVKLLPKKARTALEDPLNELWFSAVTIWEIAIKFSLRKEGFLIDPKPMRNELLRHGYRELAVRSDHALEVARLPRLHGDPFDRLLVAQATVEEMAFFTADRLLDGYGSPVRYFS